jgi:hypothetical protein
MLVVLSYPQLEIDIIVEVLRVLTIFMSILTVLQTWFSHFTKL